MSPTAERWRTWLFSPADRPDRCRKAYESSADQVIWDLEDGVAEENKDVARSELLALLEAVQDQPRIPWVRIHTPLTPRGRQDLELIRTALPRSRRRIVVPKVERDTLAFLARLRHEASWLFLVESGAGFVDLLKSDPLLAPWRGQDLRFSFGALDYQNDVGGEVGPDEMELLLPRSLLVLRSRELGLPPPIDTVYPRIADEEGLAASAARARRLGFAGKLLIHPRQVPVVQRVFRPSPEEVAWAEAVLRAAEGKGAVQVGGLMVDRPVVERAKAILAAREDDGG